MAKSQALLYLTHFLDSTVEAEFARVHRECAKFADVRLLYNTRKDKPLPDRLRALPHYLTYEEELLQLPFPNKTGRGFFPENVDLPIIKFYLDNPEFEHYWLVEYDVRFTGSWAQLLQELASSPADLLCTNVFDHALSPSWHRRFPLQLPPGVAVAAEQKLRAFFPFFRISKAGLEALCAAYREGWAGHYEAAVPTALRQAGLSLEDIGGTGAFVRPGNRNRYYLSEPRIHSLSPGTFVYRPVFKSPGRRPNTLWHPVKPGHNYRGDKLRARILRYAYRVLLAVRIALNR